MRAGRRGPRSLHLRTQDLVNLPVDELSDKYVQAMKHVQVMAGMLTGIHNIDELPVAGSYRLVSEASPGDGLGSTMPITEEGEAQGADTARATGAGSGRRPVLNDKLERQYGK